MAEPAVQMVNDECLSLARNGVRPLCGHDVEQVLQSGIGETPQAVRMTTGGVVGARNGSVAVPR